MSIESIADIQASPATATLIFVDSYDEEQWGFTTPEHHRLEKSHGLELYDNLARVRQWRHSPTEHKSYGATGDTQYWPEDENLVELIEFKSFSPSISRLEVSSDSGQTLDVELETHPEEDMPLGGIDPVWGARNARPVEGLNFKIDEIPRRKWTIIDYGPASDLQDE